jgi:hypothetical protein
MKKLMLSLSACALLLASCQKQSVNEAEEASTPEVTTSGALGHRSCHSSEVLARQLAEDPTLQARMDAIENFTQQAMRSQGRLLAGGVIEIPVVVNVVYRTTAENVSAAQIQSQIDVLNADFAATNSDYNNTPSTFTSVRSGNTNIKFVLDQVIRKSTTKTSWSTNDDVKKTRRGGIAPTSPTTKMNLWVCNLSGGVLGYAQFPGGSSSTDGVVIDDNAFGTTGSASAPFNKGRTGTHEVGHYLNLRHIWGDAACGSDGVSDTPTHNDANYGCPAAGHRSTCSGTPIEMTMNYMDYTDDACMYMFSAGQKTRMQAVFASGGARNSMAQP